MYDTIIIGGGPAGYLAAERLGSQKKKVLLIEKENLGGTCLNAGCIPTKTLLNSAKHYVHAMEAEQFGVKTEGVSFDWTKIQNRKTEVVSKLKSGIQGKMKHSGIEVLNAKAEIASLSSGEKPFAVKAVSSNGETTEYEAKTLLLCTGSVPLMPPIPGAMDNPIVVDSTALLEIKNLPKKLAVIGGGVIGIEFAGLFSSLGSEVTVIEMMDEILPFMDKELSPLLRRSMKDITFKLGCKVEKIDGSMIHYKSKEGKDGQVYANLILMAAGRKPLTEICKSSGIDFSPRGIITDDFMRTNIPSIWAAGDVTGKSLLAHSAYRMGEIAAAGIINTLDGTTIDKANRWRGNAVPWAVYGLAEAAGVGITEQEAMANGRAIVKAKLPLNASGRFLAEYASTQNATTVSGSVKVIADAQDRRVIGIHAIGPYSPEFIWGGAALIEQEFRIEDVKQLIFPHPTVSELIRDAVWAME